MPQRLSAITVKYHGIRMGICRILIHSEIISVALRCSRSSSRRCKVDIVLLRLLFNMSFSLRGIRRNEMGISTLGAIVVIVIVLLVLAFFGIFGLHW